MQLQCVILVGGLGRRLGDLTAHKPKPLIEINNKPFLQILIEEARQQKFLRFVLLAGYRSEQLSEFAQQMRKKFNDISIEISIENSPLGTAGAIANAKPLLDNEFFLLNGDSLFLFDWLHLERISRKNSSACAALALKFVNEMSRFGEVIVNGEKVISFHERGTISGGLINGGVYFLNRSIFEYLPSEGSLEKDVFPRLAQLNKLVGEQHDGLFIDIGIPSSLDVARNLFKN